MVCCVSAHDIASLQVPWKVHRYHAARPQAPLTRNAVIPKDAYQPRRADASCDFQKILSGGSSPPWYSPAVDNYCVPHADLALLDAICCNDPPCFELFSKCWLGSLFNYKHKVLVYHTSTRSWYLPLRAEAGSACTMWPMRLERAPVDGKSDVFSFKTGVAEPVLMPVWDHSEWQACSFAFRCPAWQVKHGDQIGARSKYDPNSIKIFRASPTYPLLQAAARCGFWSLPKAFLDKLAKEVECDVPAGSSLFQTAWALARKLLPAESERSAAGFLETRLVRMQVEAESSDGQYLDCIPDVEDVLEQRDEKQFAAQAKAHAEDVDCMNSFRECFRQKSAQVRSSPPDAGSSAASSSKSRKRVKRLSVPEGEIPTETVKHLAPPGATIHRSNGRGLWCGRIEPYGEVTRAWAKHGQRGSLILMLRELWTIFLDKEGLTHAHCPVDGIFPLSA